MTIQEAIAARHSVRAYKEQPLTAEAVKALEEKVAELNHHGRLHMQLVQNEPKAFQGTLAKYGRFRGVSNYIVMAGQKADDLDERVDLAQQMGTTQKAVQKQLVDIVEILRHHDDSIVLWKYLNR